MADDKYTFEQARVRLEEIVTQVRRKDVSLETSIELLEEGVRLANMCTELSDHTEWRTVAEEQESGRLESDAPAVEPIDDESAEDDGSTPEGAEAAEDGSVEAVDSDAGDTAEATSSISADADDAPDASHEAEQPESSEE